MSRDDGFGHADVDVGLLDDPKVRQLIRSTKDEGLIARCLIAYTAVVLASWERGTPLTLEDAAPLWLTDLDDLRARLTAVGLVDEDGRIPPKPWERWFGVAVTRRDAGRDRWRRWNQRQKGSRQAGSPTGSTGPTDSQSGSQSVQTSPQRLPNVGQRTDEPLRERTNGRAKETCPTCGDLLDDKDTNAVLGPGGQLWHRECPSDMAVAQ
jgi:hypothetical protein